jgi:hypothetical protein
MSLMRATDDAILVSIRLGAVVVIFAVVPKD